MMSHVTGQRWETAHQVAMRFEHGSRGSGGVTVLFEEELQSLIHILRMDDHARYMWVRLRADSSILL